MKNPRYVPGVPFFKMMLRISMAVAITLPTTDVLAESDCQLQYPIVLSHHFGARKICPDNWSVTECAAREPDAIARYCAHWDEESGCASWTLPPDEQHLPPRKVNANDSNLVRTDAVHAYHRYYSKAIVERLEACGNQVFLADKPAFASYQIRARSLRATVLAALAQTGADKVVVMGFSQGVQDARYMVARLAVDDRDTSQGLMRDRIAAVVSLAGEHAGAESASLLLSVAYLSNYVSGLGWGDFEAGRAAWDIEGGERYLDDLLWRERGAAATDQDVQHQPWVLSEFYDPGNPREYNLTTDQKYRAFLHAITNLSTQYMTGKRVLDRRSWDALRDFLGMEESGWRELVNAGNERCNGVAYLSYGARIRRWDPTSWGDGTTYYLLRLFQGENDGYVTIDSQRFDRLDYAPCQGQEASNFHHRKTLDGQFWSHGYHHMFFSGRNAADGPGVGEQEPGYEGQAADVYEQVARDLRQAGF